jgi:hypothetical protein
MDATTPDAALVQSWNEVRRKLVKRLPRGAREHLDALVLGLIAPARQRVRADEMDRVERADRLAIGVETAVTLAKGGITDLEVLAAAVALPWYSGNRGALASVRPLTWPVAMILAMTRPHPRPGVNPVGRDRAAYLQQLLGLPPLLRALVIIQRDVASARHNDSPYSRSKALPFDQVEFSILAPGIPPKLLPRGKRPPGEPLQPPPPPIGSPREAVDLLKRARRELNDWRFGSYRLSVPGDPNYIVVPRELYYLVRWDVPAEEIHEVGPPVVDPGDMEPRPRYQLPGWRIDRVTHHLATQDLAHVDDYPVDSYYRAVPLPPGWRPDGRPAIVDGPAADLATLLPAPLHAALEPVMREATARYRARLTTEAWPDFLVAWQTARHTVWLLANTGCTDPELLTAALLAARGTAPIDTLVEDSSGLWQTPAGAHARAARPGDDETDTPEATTRAHRLTAEPAPLRALVFANAWARRNAETELFGATPPARTRELNALSILVHDQPAFHRFG